MLFQTIPKHIDESLKYIEFEELNEMPLADIIDICRERNLPTNGKKSQLISELIFWRDHTKPIPAPSTPRLNSLSDLTEPIRLQDPIFNFPTDQRQGLNSQQFSHLFLDEHSSSLSIPFQDLIYVKKIGSGGFKDCYEGVYKGEPVAIGELRFTHFSELDLAEVKHEINVLKQLRHENVINFIGVCTHPSHLCIVTELCSKGDLFDVIRKYPRPSFAQQVMHMYDIALGVSYLHTRRPSIIHRDLKSMNILISGDERAKINDFGLARIRPKANALMHTQCGTPNWQGNMFWFTFVFLTSFKKKAPEFWTSNPSYTEKVDVYACGLIFWEILTWGVYGYPYQNLAEHALYVAVKEHDIRPPMSKLSNLYPRNLLVLIMEMWETDPLLRPSMSHVVERLSTYLN